MKKVSPMKKANDVVQRKKAPMNKGRVSRHEDRQEEARAGGQEDQNEGEGEEQHEVLHGRLRRRFGLRIRRTHDRRLDGDAVQGVLLEGEERGWSSATTRASGPPDRGRKGMKA